MIRALWACLLLCCTPSLVLARADFVMITVGDGWDDPTPVAPVGGNDGTTLGEQRRLALARALELWGAELDSPVPIRVHATFETLSCTTRGAVLGQAFAWQFIRGFDGTSGGPYYPSALADRIAGEDLAPGTPDLGIELNASIDAAPCSDIAGRWYYGFDGLTGGDNDLIQVALHELGHGLGFASVIDPETGESAYEDAVDVFSTHVRDLDLDATWDQLTAAQRQLSVNNVRRLVFEGPEARAFAQDWLARGEPSLVLTPALPDVDLTRSVSDVENARSSALSPVSGPLRLANPTDACQPLLNQLAGYVALAEVAGDCTYQEALERLAAAGALGVVFVQQAPADAPSEPLDAFGEGSAVPIPALTIAADAGIRIAGALANGPIAATLGGTPDRLLGADAQGQPLLFASRPALRGSSVSHFDSLARPSFLMEAYVQGGGHHELDITPAALRDLGWAVDCGNGVLDLDEQCDDGPANADEPGARCRPNCRLPGCGDGVVEGVEVCDRGAANSDTEPDACRTDCMPARCGDGVMDAAEACDQGRGNSATMPGACRPDCTLARCGDGVVDPGESCDGTAACPSSCMSPPDAGAVDEPSDAGVRPAPSGDPQDGDPGEAGEDRAQRRASGGCALAPGDAPLAWPLLLLALRRRRVSRAGACGRRRASRPSSGETRA